MVLRQGQIPGERRKSVVGWGQPVERNAAQPAV